MDTNAPHMPTEEGTATTGNAYSVHIVSHGRRTRGRARMLGFQRPWRACDDRFADAGCRESHSEQPGGLRHRLGNIERRVEAEPKMGRRGRSTVDYRDGVDDGTRTRDNRNHNPGLYQLSYVHHFRTVACPTGLEPVTPSLEGWCSIRMSYGHQIPKFETAAFQRQSHTAWDRDLALNATLPRFRGSTSWLADRLE